MYQISYDFEKKKKCDDHSLAMYRTDPCHRMAKLLSPYFLGLIFLSYMSWEMFFNLIDGKEEPERGDIFCKVRSNTLEQ